MICPAGEPSKPMPAEAASVIRGAFDDDLATAAAHAHMK